MMSFGFISEPIDWWAGNISLVLAAVNQHVRLDSTPGAHPSAAVGGYGTLDSPHFAEQKFRMPR